MNIGDVVVLKSGGLNMTINSVDGDTFHCMWFNPLVNGYSHETFHKDSIKKAD